MWVIVLIIFVVVVGIFFSGDSDESVELDIFGIADLWTGATAIIADYDADKIAANETYDGKVLLISGVITEVAKDITDTPYIEMEGRLRCAFDERYADEFVQLRKDQIVSLHGKGDGFSASFVNIKGCRVFFADHAPPGAEAAPTSTPNPFDIVGFPPTPQVPFDIYKTVSRTLNIEYGACCLRWTRKIGQVGKRESCS